MRLIGCWRHSRLPSLLRYHLNTVQTKSCGARACPFVPQLCYSVQLCSACKRLQKLNTNRFTRIFPLSYDPERAARAGPFAGFAENDGQGPQLLAAAVTGRGGHQDLTVLNAPQDDEVSGFGKVALVIRATTSLPSLSASTIRCGSEAVQPSTGSPHALATLGIRVWLW